MLTKTLTKREDWKARANLIRQFMQIEDMLHAKGLSAQLENEEDYSCSYYAALRNQRICVEGPIWVQATSDDFLSSANAPRYCICKSSKL